MDILRKNTLPSFEIVSRYKLNISLQLRFLLINEFTRLSSEILANVTLLDNENYRVTLLSFPISEIGNKFSYTLIENLSLKIVSLGKILVVSETENVQEYSKIQNTKFYN